MRIPYLFLFLLCIFFSGTLYAQTEMHVYGYVFNAEREPAPYVTIQVVGTDAGTTSRNDGYYELNFKIQDTATIKYSFIGCDTVYYKVFTKQPRVQKIIYLQESAVLLKGVEKKVYRQQTSTSDNLDLSRLKNIPDVAGGGIESLISTYAGVSSTNELSSQYSVRGGNYDENSVYVNDIEVYRPLLVSSGQQEGLSFINPDLASSVSFSAGGFEPKYGDKMASVLDIKYKKPKAFEASVAGSLLGGSAYVGQISKDKKFTQIHGIRYKSSNYMLGSLPTKGLYDQRFLDYQTFMTYAFSKKWEVNVLGNFSQNKYTNIPDSLTTTFGTLDSPTTFRVYFDGQEKDVFQTLFGAATLKYSPNKNLSLSAIASAFNTKEDVDYDITGEYFLSDATLNEDNTVSKQNILGTGSYLNFARNELTATVKGISHRGEYQMKKNKLEWGAGIQQEYISDRIDEFQVRDSAGYSLPYNQDLLALYYNLNANTTLTSYRTQGFIQDAFKTGRFSFVGGLRTNYWTFNKELLLSPRITVAFIPKWKRDILFRFATGVYYQSPFYKEIRDTVVDNQRNAMVTLNNNIKAERSLHFVLGSDYRFTWAGRPFKFTSEIYYKPADRVITYTVDNVKIIYSGTNDAKAYTEGVDFKLFGEFVPGTDSWINLSFMNSKEEVIGSGNGWVSRPNEQRTNFSMFFQDYFPGYPKYKVHLKFIWADGLPFWAPNVVHTEQNTGRSRSYRRVDIGTTRAIAKGDSKWLDKLGIFKTIKAINLGLEVFNLLDIDNVESYYWVTDIYGKQHAVPNTLTGRRFNVKLAFDF